MALVLNTEYNNVSKKAPIHANYTDIEDVPWQVSLQIQGSHICSGSIYKEHFVITAAHCVFGRKPEAFQIRAGSSTTVSGGFLLNVTAIKSHKDYKIHSIENDIAIMRLNKPFPLKDSVSLAETNPVGGAVAISNGWPKGFVTIRSVTPHKPVILRSKNLISVKMTIISKTEYSNFSSSIRKERKKKCFLADTGSPLVVDGKLVAIATGITGVYTSIPSLIKWISEIEKDYN